jgi:hypothetical protein
MENQNNNLYSLIASHCYRKYKNIIDKSNNEGGHYCMGFSSISKIDNIKVKSALKIPCSKRCSHMIFELRDKFPPYKNLFVYSCSFERGENNEFTEENIKDMLTFINDLVHKLKFDKITGNFQEYTEPFGTQFVDGEQCCVCYETTMTKTVDCNHYICRCCFQKLVQKYTCPVCRAKTHIDEDSDFEYSDENEKESDSD